MSKKELTVNKNKKPHGHWKMAIKDLETGDVEHQVGGFRSDVISLDEATDQLTYIYQFTEYNKSYAFYKDGATEYLRFEGTVAGLRLRLTIDVFTCYCEPLNENQEPPF